MKKAFLLIALLLLTACVSGGTVDDCPPDTHTNFCEVRIGGDEFCTCARNDVLDDWYDEYDY